MIDFERIFEEHGARLTELAASIAGTRADGEDVVQEAFARAFRSRAGFRGEASPLTWIRRIVVNEAIEHRRRRRPEVARPFGASDAEEGPGAASLDPGGRGPGPLAIASESERAAAVRRAIDALPDEQRTAILLREMEGMGYREIAEMLGWPLGTVESRVLRGRERLRRALTAHEEPAAEEPSAGTVGRGSPPPGQARGGGRP